MPTAMFKTRSEYKNSHRGQAQVWVSPHLYSTTEYKVVKDFSSSYRVRWTLCWPFPFPKGCDHLGAGVN